MAGIKNATVNLSKQDVEYIARVVETEVDHGLAKRDPEAYKQQIAAVTDTIINRAASGYFPNTIEGVANQRRQFSAINGPKTYVDQAGVRRKTNSPGSVDKVDPASEIVQTIVGQHLQARAEGAPSSIGENLNYANPKTSSPNNSGWIEAMRKQPGAQVIGREGFQHIHGTAPWSQRAKINADVALDGYEPKSGFKPYSPPVPVDNPDFRPVPTPRPRSAALSAPVGDVDGEALPDLETALLNMAPRPVKTIAVGPDPRDQAERDFGKTSWDNPAGMDEAFAKSRSAFASPANTGTAGMTKTAQNNAVKTRIDNVWDRIPTAPKPASQGFSNTVFAASPQVTRSESETANSRINNAFAAIPAGQSSRTVSTVGGRPATSPGYSGGNDDGPGYTSSQFSGSAKTTDRVPQAAQPQTPSQAYQRVPVTTMQAQRVPVAKPSSGGGMTLDNVGDFAFGPSSINTGQMNANAFGTPAAPIPAPRPQYETVMTPVTTYKNVPVPTIKPHTPMTAAQPAQDESFLGSIFGQIFTPGNIAGAAGTMIGGPVAGIAARVATNVVPAVGRNVFGNGNGGSGGGYYNGTHIDGRAYNPTIGKYVNSKNGRVSSNQSLGSGGTFATINAIANKAKNDFGGGGSSGSDKIVCTAMNERYGFGGFRNAIWLKYAADNLSPAHEAGYHAIFRPLVNYGFGGNGPARSIVRKTLEHIARERTADLRAVMGKTRRRRLGRAYRLVLEPICWIVGTMKLKKSR